MHVFPLKCLCALPEVSVLAVRGYTRSVWSWAGWRKWQKKRLMTEMGRGGGFTKEMGDSNKMLYNIRFHKYIRKWAENYQMMVVFAQNWLLNKGKQTEMCYFVSISLCQIILQWHCGVFIAYYFKKPQSPHEIKMINMRIVWVSAYLRTRCRFAESRGSVNWVVRLLWSTK